MKLIKTSIIFVFLLSLLTAGVSVYLSSIRENEKEKRIYLEGVRSELETHVQELEGEKAELQSQVRDFETKNRTLANQLNEERQAHKRTSALVQEKDLNLKNLRTQVTDAQDAFENAQKRNQELERILDELEARMRQVEEQKMISADQSGVGFVEMSVTPTALPAEEPSESFQESSAPEIASPQTLETSVSTVVQPVTPLPSPPKRRRFFPFFRGSDKAEPEKVEEVKVEEVSEEKPAETFVVSEEVVTPPPVPVEPIKPKIGPPQKADQTISGGNVLLVNRNYNFIVINLGSRQGISMNDVLAVRHKGNEVAKVRVEKLYDDYAAAYIVEEQSEQPIGEGDVVTAA